MLHLPIVFSGDSFFLLCPSNKRGLLPECLWISYKGAGAMSRKAKQNKPKLLVTSLKIFVISLLFQQTACPITPKFIILSR